LLIELSEKRFLVGKLGIYLAGEYKFL
jgi:hypothetical protein